MRCVHEQQMHEHNSFITLTYDDENLPEYNSLVYRDFQLFIKRLRKALCKGEAGIRHSPREHDSGHSRHGALPHTPTLRFYMCGEYGENFGRPHYHACLFGIDFNDKKLHSTNRGNTLYTSPTLDKIWAKGHATTGELTFESAAYTARYIMKKITGQAATLHYEKTDPETGEIIRREPEFNHMSLKPGIGAEWINKFKTDVYPGGNVVIRGKESRSPKYYDRRLKKTDPQQYEDLLWSREQEGMKRASDNTTERLKVREQVATAKIRQLKRTLK